MSLAALRFHLASFSIAALALAPAFGAQDAAKEASAKEASAKQPAAASVARTAGAARVGAKGPLPDPVLLDGSTLPVEKRPEQGMIGDFELPGDENVRNGKVGGPQGAPQAAAGGQQMPQGLPQMGGGGPQSDQAQQQGGGGAQGAPAAGGAQAASQGAQGASGGPMGPSDPNAAAEGMQVGQLETDPNAGGAQGQMAGVGAKPPPVAIGDKAMQIKSAPGAASAVGAAMPAGATQQMESKTGGGRGSSSVSGGRNAAEKGRAMPAGL